GDHSRRSPNPWSSGTSSPPQSLRQDPLLHIAVQRSEGPRTRRRYQPMLDRVEVNIICASLEIALIADGVLPKATLPQRILTALVRRKRQVFRHDRFGELRLDHLPAAREITIAGRQSEDRVQVFWQHDDCGNCKWLARLRLSKRGAEKINMIDKRSQSPVPQADREEESAPGNKVSPISNHGQTRMPFAASSWFAPDCAIGATILSPARCRSIRPTNCRRIGVATTSPMTKGLPSVVNNSPDFAREFQGHQ